MKSKIIKIISLCLCTAILTCTSADALVSNKDNKAT